MSNEVTCLKSEQDVNLWVFVEVVKTGWQWLVGGAVLGLVGAVAFIVVVPAQYEATAIIQPATVGMPTTTTTTTTTTTKGTDVESAAQTLERLKVPTFYSEELLKACDVKTQANPRQTLVSDVKPTLIKGNSLIQISYRAESPAIAEGCVGAIVAQLAKAQAALAEPIVKTLEEQRKLTKQQLDESERFQSQIEKRAMTLDPSDAKFSQAMLMLNAALSKREEITKLHKQYVEQSVALSEPFTQSAKLFEPIYASDKAVFPKKALTAFGGLFIGLLLGGVALLIRGIWSARQKLNLSA